MRTPDPRRQLALKTRISRIRDEVQAWASRLSFHRAESDQPIQVKRAHLTRKLHEWCERLEVNPRLLTFDPPIEEWSRGPITLTEVSAIDLLGRLWPHQATCEVQTISLKRVDAVTRLGRTVRES